MNEEQLREQGFVEQPDGSWRKPRRPANATLAGARAVAVVECAAGHASLGQNKSETPTTSRLHIRFVSVRKRLCDPDNLSAKWLLDCLRYCHVIEGDEPDKITLEVSQRKAAKGETEETVIEVYELA